MHWIPAVFPILCDTEGWAFLREGDCSLSVEDLAQGHDGTPVIVAPGGNGPSQVCGPTHPEAAGERPVSSPYEHPILSRMRIMR